MKNFSTSIQRRKRGTRTEYYARLTYYDQTGKRKGVSKSAATLCDAKRELQGLIDQHEAGGSEVLEARNMTFAALAQHCKETRYCEAFYDEQGRKLYGVREPKKFASIINRLVSSLGHLKLTANTLRVTSYKGKTVNRRFVPITDRLRVALLDLRTKPSVAAFRKLRNGDTADNTLVFGVVDSLKKSFDAARIEAGLPHIRFHDLRHTAGTFLAHGGMNIALVAEILAKNNIAAIIGFHTNVQRSAISDRETRSHDEAFDALSLAGEDAIKNRQGSGNVGGLKADRLVISRNCHTETVSGVK
jgi:hypothetical protein